MKLGNRKTIGGFILTLLLVLPSYGAKKDKTIGDLIKKINKTPVNLKGTTKSRSALPTAGSSKNIAVKNVMQIKPPSQKSYASGAQGQEAELEKAIDKSIRQLYLLIKKYKKSNRRGELWLRQGELYVEKARIVERQIYNKYDKEMEKFKAKKRGTRPKVNLRPARVYYQKAAKLYEWFLKDFPKDRKRDQALFFMGYVSFELGKEKEGSKFYAELTKKFPRSLYVSEANFALGEFYFEREDWKPSLKYYTATLKDKKSRLFSFALYKRAWAKYRMGLVGKGLIDLESVVKRARYAKKRGESKNSNKIRLASEALRDMVLFYSEVGNYKTAESYFRKWGGKKQYIKMLDSLSLYYSSRGQFEQARFTLKTLISKQPFAPKAFEYQKQIVQNYQAAGKRAHFKKELWLWVLDYGKDSQWYAKNQTNKEVISESDAEREKALRNYTLAYHKQAQNTKSVAAFRQAKDGYRLYLDKFSQSDKIDEMYFFFGELLYDMKSYSSASEMYAWVVKNSPKSKYHSQAALNQVLALEKELPNENEIMKIVGNTKEMVEMPKTVRVFIIRSQEYLKLYPKGDTATEIRFKVGRLYYQHNHFDKAEQFFREIVKTDPKSKYSGYSANLILDIYNLKGDYKGLAKIGTSILNTSGIKDPKILEGVKTIVEKAAFKAGQDFEAKKNYVGAAAAYQKFAKTYPDSVLTSTAYFNAAVNAERAGLILEAIPLYERVKKDNTPRNANLRKKSILLQASLYEKTGDLEKAALIYESYGDLYKTDKLRADLYFNAARIWDGSGKVRKAVITYSKYLATSTKRDKNDANYYIAKMYFGVKNLNQADSFFRKYVNSGSANQEFAAEAYYSLGEIQDMRNRNSAALVWYRRTIDKTGGNKPKVIYYKAAAKLKQVLAEYDRFAAIKIPRNPARQAAVVQQKLAMLQKLNLSFASVIKFNSGEQIISSLIWAAKANDHMAKAILEAPLPSGLSGNDLEKYKEQIERIAEPMENVALEKYEQAIEKAFELDIYSNDLIKAYKVMGRIKPKSYRYWERTDREVRELDMMEM